MALNGSDLANYVIGQVDLEVQALIYADDPDSDPYFHYDSFDSMSYLQYIYDYIRDNTEVTVAYSGVNSETGVLDPASGAYTFGLVSTGGQIPRTTIELLQKAVIGPTPALIDAQVAAWFTQLETSCLPLQLSATTSDLTTLVIAVAPAVILTPVPRASMSDDEKADRLKIWKNIGEAIISSIKTSIFTPGTAVNAVINTGTATVVSIN